MVRIVHFVSPVSGGVSEFRSLPPLSSETFDTYARERFNRRRPSRSRCDVLGLVFTALGTNSKGARCVTTVVLLSAVANIIGVLIWTCSTICARSALPKKAHERSKLHVRSTGSGRSLAQQAFEGRLCVLQTRHRVQQANRNSSVPIRFTRRICAPIRPPTHRCVEADVRAGRTARAQVTAQVRVRWYSSLLEPVSWRGT